MRIVKKIKRMIFSKVMLFALALGLSQSAFAQITATGVVVDASKEPLIGVNVVVVGTNNGTITDFDGNFELSCPAGSKLEISYVGYKTQVVTASSSMKITLQEDVTELATVEVVSNIGYGTMRKSDLTGAIASVSADEMKKGVVTSSEQLLQGKIAGLQVVQGSGDPTKGSSLRLRGGSSLSGENAPLVVVDGIANVDMNTVQPSEIVSVDVLKDASACAIYGSRGANGVIIVTTNRKNKESFSASYAGYVGVGQAAKKMDLADASDWVADGRNDYGTDTDWQDEITRTAISHSHALTFSGSTEKSGFKGSMSYLNSQGVVRTSDLERIAASVSGYTTVWDNRLRLESGIHTNTDDYQSFDYQSIFYNAYNESPTLPVMQNGAYMQADELVPAAYNPMEIMKKNKSKQNTLRLMAFGKAELTIIDGLKGTVNLSYNKNNGRSREYKDRDSKMYSIYSGHATQTYSNYNEKQLEVFFNYDKTFNNLHKLNLMAGYSYSSTFSDGFGGAKYNFTTDDWLYNNMSAATEYQYFYSYKNTTALASFFGRVNYSYAGKYMFTATIRRDGSSKFGANNKWGTFPSASLAWRITDEQFMQNTSNWLDNLKLRAGYGVTGNQGGITPYNSLMTMAPNAQGTVTTYIDDNGDEQKFVGLVCERNPNPDLKWESTGQFNVGLDFGLFKRLNGSIEFYHKKTWDLLYFYTVGSDYPVQDMLLNIGDLKNYGVEATLNATIMKTDNFSWTADLNLAHNHNEVVKLTDERFANTEFWGGQLKHGASSYEGLTGDASYTQCLTEGESIGTFYGAKYAGRDEEGKMLYWHTDEETGERTKVSQADLNDADKHQKIGCAMPKLTMGFGMNFSYKKWDLSLATYGMFGQKVYNATAMDLSTRHKTNMLSDVMKSSEENENFVSDYWLENASFFRIQNITLGYTFDLKKIKMNSLRIYATVENPFVFTGYSGIDPEVSIDMNVTESDPSKRVYPGIDSFNNYPKARTYILGVNLQF